MLRNSLVDGLDTGGREEEEKEEENEDEFDVGDFSESDDLIIIILKPMTGLGAVVQKNHSGLLFT